MRAVIVDFFLKILYYEYLYKNEQIIIIIIIYFMVCGLQDTEADNCGQTTASNQTAKNTQKKQIVTKLKITTK